MAMRCLAILNPILINFVRQTFETLLKLKAIVSIEARNLAGLFAVPRFFGFLLANGFTKSTCVQ